MNNEIDEAMSLKQKCLRWAALFGPGETKCRELYHKGCPFEEGDDAILAWIATRPQGLTNPMAKKLRAAVFARTGPPKSSTPIESGDSSGNSYADTVADQGRLVKFLTNHLKAEMDSGLLPSQEIFDMRDKAIHRQRELARDEQKIREAGQAMIPREEAVDAVQRVVSLYDDSWDQVGFKLLDRMRGEKMENMPEIFEVLRLEVGNRINSELSEWTGS